MAGAARFRALGRMARLVALLCFLLPFATISCSSRQLTDAFNNAMGPSASPTPVPRTAPERCVLIRATGVQLALGMAEPAEECLHAAAGFLPDAGPQSLADTPLARSDPAVVLAFLLVVLSLALGFIRKGRLAVFGGAAGNVLAILATIWAIFVRLPQALHGFPPPASAPVTQEQLSRILEVNGGIGFWLMVLFLVLAIVLDLLALNRAEPLAARPAPS